MAESPRKLTKEDIIRGVKKVEDVVFEELGGSITLRPLTDGEYLHAQIIVLNAMKAGGSLDELKKAAADAKKKGSKGNPFDGMNIQMDVGALTEAEYEQSVYIVSCGMIDPKLTLAEVKDMQPIGIVKKIATKILEMSGVGKELEAQIDTFRKK